MSAKATDLTGTKFGNLVVIERAGTRTYPNGKTQPTWACRCNCGNTVVITGSNLKSGNTSSCGCLRRNHVAHNRKDLTGKTFDRLTVIGLAPSRDQYGTVMGYWLCQCICGTEIEVLAGNLIKGNTRSCGCRQYDPALHELRSAAHRTHGHNNRNSPTYATWSAMRKRCRDEANHNYHGRGIDIDPSWDDFETFLTDMGERPNGTTLDRIDNDGPYCKSNCRWATGITQSNNRRNNRRLTFKGRTLTISEWAREAGISSHTISARLERGWSVTLTLTTPVNGFHPFAEHP